ncbi:MAG: alpha/beta fold hydrolase, partial [Hyphomicrobiaceae bacterium]
ELSGPIGAPVVCLSHCFGADYHFWTPHLPAFEGFRVLRYDTRGHGQSRAPSGPFSLEMLAGDTLALLDALAIDRVHFAGVSMGGMIGQTIAIDHADRIGSLALINTTPRYSAEQRELWRERGALVESEGVDVVHADLMRRWFTDHAIASKLPGYNYMAEVFRRFEPASFAAAASALCQLDTVHRLQDISVPTLVVAADDDPGVPVALSQLLADRIAGAMLHWLSPARHLASLEHVDAFNGIMRKFLAEVGQR